MARRAASGVTSRRPMPVPPVVITKSTSPESAHSQIRLVMTSSSSDTTSYCTSSLVGRRQFFAYGLPAGIFPLTAGAGRADSENSQSIHRRKKTATALDAFQKGWRPVGNHTTRHGRSDGQRRELPPSLTLRSGGSYSGSGTGEQRLPVHDNRQRRWSTIIDESWYKMMAMDR